MKKIIFAFISFSVFVNVVWASPNAGMYVINKLDEDIYVFANDYGVIYAKNEFGEKTYRKNFVLFPNQKSFLLIKCKENLNLSAKGKSSEDFYTIDLNPKCGQYYNWNVTLEDKN